MRLRRFVVAVALITSAGISSCGRGTSPQDAPRGDAAGRNANSQVDEGESRSRLRIELGEDGAYLLRGGAIDGRAQSAHRATGRLDGAAGDVRSVLAALEAAFAEITADPRTRGADGSSDLLLEVAADPLVPWKRVPWVLLTAASPRVGIWKVAFNSGGQASPVRIDLPKDRSCCPGAHAIRLELRVKLRRTQTSAEQSPATRVALSTAYVEYDKGYMCPAFDGPEAAVVTVGHFDLPSVAGSSQARRVTWGRIENALGEQIQEGDRPLGILVTPPPRGGGVPYRDVVAAMLALQRIGAEPIHLEGAVALPTDEDR